MQGEATVAAPSNLELERAIASVPGVADATVTVAPETGRRRLRIRLVSGEDSEAISWAVAATLRERFGIALDPAAIRPRPADAAGEADPADEGRPAHESAEDEHTRVSAGARRRAATDRLAEAAQAALEGMHGTVGRPRRHEPIVGEGRRPTDPLFSADGDDVVQHNGAEHGAAAARVPEEPAAEEAARAPAEPESAAAEPEPTDAEPEATDAEPEPTDAEPAAEPESEPTGTSAASAEESEEPAESPEEPTVEESLAGMPIVDLDEPATITLADLPELESEEPGRALPGSRRRAAIHDLTVRHAPDTVEITATLRLGDFEVRGEASGVPTNASVLRAVSEATLAALRQLTDDVVLAGIDEVSVDLAGDPATARVIISVVDDGGEQTLLGAALVRGDIERAVMRATLDALNRRLEPALLSMSLP